VFQVGDVIRNRITREEGHIVRVVNGSDIEQTTGADKPAQGLAYVVLLPSNGHWREREVLWRDSAVDAAERGSGSSADETGIGDSTESMA